MNEETRKENIKTLHRHREFLDRTRVSVATAFDKYLLTLSSGGFYLSIYFTSSLRDGLIYKKWLCLGWFFLIATIVFMLLSIYFSVKAHEKEIENVDAMIGDIDDGKEPRTGANCVNGIVTSFEIVGGVSFIFGITFLAYFYFINL